MALVNQAKREINAKIVFFGPGLAGKATNLKHVFSKLKPEFRGAMKAMNVQDARMLFFDFTPPGDGNVHGFKVRFHVYTVSGPLVDPAAWKMVLKGVDGVVFVADAAANRQAANRESLENLTSYLSGYGQSLTSVPTVFQFNKSDLPEALELAELERILNPSKLPSFLASSQSGEGVLQTLLGLVKTVLGGLRDRGLEGVASGETLQRIVQAPAAPQATGRMTAADTVAAPKEMPEVELEFATPAQEMAPAASVEVSAPTLAGEPPDFQPRVPASEVADEPLSLEIAGAPQAAGDGTFRLPLTIRAGGRRKTVLLNLALSLEEE
jgi:signal recognition particle receptor subunit beta